MSAASPVHLKEVQSRVIDFWLNKVEARKRFSTDPQLDKQIRMMFLDDHRAAMQKKYEAMKETVDGAVALIILLDQFSRNMFRATPEMYAADPYCIELTLFALEKKFDVDLHKRGAAGRDKLMFLLMPLMHSEMLEMQDLLMEKFDAYGIDKTYAMHHRNDIKRYGRFPSRNTILGRTSTPEELEYIASPTAWFNG